MFIRSERLFLRPGWPEDRDELLARIDDWAVVRNLGFTPETAQALVTEPQDRRFPAFAVTLPTSDGSRLIGSVGLLRGERGAELAYWIAHDHAGQGFATEACRAVLSLARTLGHREIFASHFTDDAASGRILGKLAFRATGEIIPRLCAVRGVRVPAVLRRRDLGPSSNCDGGFTGDDARCAA